MKIVEFQAENFKRLKAVRITPTGSLVQITGPNRAGKSSVLDAIEAALRGAGAVPTKPIRTGTDKAMVRLNLGPYIVERRFTTKNPGGTLTVLADDAVKLKPQAILDGLMGEIAFDPLAFSRMKGKDRFEELKRIAKVDFDFEQSEGQTRADFATRAELNRTLQQKRMAAGVIVIMPDTPEEPVDVDALTDLLANVAAANTAIDAQAQERQRRRAEVAEADAEAHEKRAEAVRLRAQADELEGQAEEILRWVETEKSVLDDMPPLPEKGDPQLIRQEIDRAHSINRAVEKRREKAQLEQEAAALKEQADALTAAMEAREANKIAAIKGATMPLPNLTFGENDVLLDGVPFDQASDAQRLIASTKIAMAGNPTLRIIRIRDGSLLDSQSLALLAGMAEAEDYQVWIERVDETGEVGIVMEDGEVKADHQPAAPQEGPQEEAAPKKDTAKKKAKPTEKTGGLL